MKNTDKTWRNSSAVSIRKAPAQSVLSDTYEDEKPQVPILDIEALRTIGRIIQAIKGRIDDDRASEE
jgi:hypothetical protein